MEEKIEDVDGEPVVTLSTGRPHRKTNSYTQFGNFGFSGGTKRNTVRKHSLDEERIGKNFDRYLELPDDEYNLSGAGGGIGGFGSVSEREYMSQFKEQNPADGSDEQRRPLPEFIGSGGGTGIFKVPVRAAVHPGRPPSLELRPHPLRETQVGSFLRTITCTETQLWAGQECGVRCWNFSDVFVPGCGFGKVRRGDEDAAPFQESAQTPPTICIVVDKGNRLIWTGHKDGRIRSWKMDQSLDGTSFKEGLSWLAHRGPVLSMVISAYGDLWSGSEGGSVKIWPWESIEKSLSLTAEERRMAALLVERSCVDLRSQVTINGVCSISASDVKFLLSDNSRGKVWSAGSQSFALWDARTRELLKVFNVDGQIENRGDMSSMQDSSVEDEVKTKSASTSKKEKPQGFLQRSRNAIMGAADAVRRVAVKGGALGGAFLDDNRRTEAALLTMDGMIWTGCASGLLVQWDGNGSRIQDFHHHSSPVQSICTYGARIWVGYVSGTIQVLDLEGNLLGGWVAHNGPVIKIAIGAGYIFTLASHGGIRGWSLASPGPLDNILRSELTSKEHLYMKLENLKILTGTWNVGQGRASNDSLVSWLGSVASDVGVIVVGLQEVEMGAGFLAMSAAKETVGLEGSSIGQWWLDTIGKTLDDFERLGSRQLAALLIAVWVRKSLKSYIGDVDAAAVPCGFGRAIGNKGAVGLRLRVYDRLICFACCHFAAHLEAVNRRNADFDHIYRTMVFSRSSNLFNAAAAGVSSAVQLLRGTNAAGVHTEDAKPELPDADMVVFFGDFNYRLHSISYDEARDHVSQRCFDWLRERDQLRKEMKAGKVFQGMREALITFPPTYKFEKHKPGLAGYDSGEKKRIPAWCDRVLYRDNRSTTASECNLQCPVVASIIQYEACMDVTDSDHKPVRCIFNIDIARMDESIKRQEFGDIIKSNEKIRALIEELCVAPETIVSTDNIILQNQDTSLLKITNKCADDKALFEIICEGQSTAEDGKAVEYRARGSHGFPRWLEVTPAVGVIKPGQTVEVIVRHQDFHAEDLADGSSNQQNWSCEDNKDKEVILVINVQGSCSTETRNHRVSVRLCPSAKTLRTSSSKKNQINFNRSDSQNRSVSSDVVDDARNLQTP
ncbi:PREDICTED: type I inositol polyphosphate 5-phosphatase 12-like isoform X2 [Nelumbo nucifera]|uniref:Type I inositol polyphosphate 5-phosphatase 12-like isoform X2 n=2 Tax=Nelumbo nucifera TaxID=4432 RepID=A0A1U7ZC37_NELNU|nr:PREDICTED: type I inositol polyphosphate 5-phosphatase 12-like isoform X2 [Nelumbo nucifera]DAD36018.1 TPA_asm: hypothetical protein HUJ06_006658 [Nelumbo nucifera]